MSLFKKSFINDEDGFSAKDFLMVLIGTLFVLMIATAFIVSIVGTLNPSTIAVIQLMDGVVITIVGGVFGLQGIREFKTKPTTQVTIESEDSTYNDYRSDEEDVGSDTPKKLP